MCFFSLLFLEENAETDCKSENPGRIRESTSASVHSSTRGCRQVGGGLVLNHENLLTSDTQNPIHKRLETNRKTEILIGKSRENMKETIRKIAANETNEKERQ
jgi:hypothetical protein